MNKMGKINNQRGFITTIIIIIIALVALKYAFHFDIVEYWKSAQVQGYVHATESWIKTAYDWTDKIVAKYLKK